MTFSSPTTPNHAARKHRRRWPWITAAVVVAIFVLAGVFGGNQQPQPASVPASDTGAIVTSTHTAPPATTTTTVPVTTVAPVTTTVPHPTVKAVVVAPHPTVHHTATHHTVTHRTVTHPVVTHAPVTHRTTAHRAPATTTAPPAGRYHAGEFCKTLGATAISSTGAAMTCIQEGDYKRWHND